jgi:dynein intermediate chain 2
MLSSISVQGTMQHGGKLVAIGDVTGTVSLLELCESLAVSQSNERKAIDMMFEREMKQEKNLEAREKEMKRLRAQEQLDRSREAQEKKDAKDEKMESLLRQVPSSPSLLINEKLTIWLSQLGGR